jgi:hypothetical protein
VRWPTKVKVRNANADYSPAKDNTAPQHRTDDEFGPPNQAVLSGSF